MKELNGKWQYQSFCPGAIQWAPPTQMNLKTGGDGEVTGEAKLGPFEATIEGKVLAEDKGVELTVKLELPPVEYSLRGYFLADSDQIVGSVVAVKNDLGKQPDGTAGSFALFPKED